MRSILVGDIHGCFREMQELLKVCALDEEKDQLILLGDLMDRGPDSYDVFMEAQRLKQSMGNRFVLLKGSHEMILMKKDRPLRDELLWERIGKKETVSSFERHGKKVEECLPWLEENVVPYYVGDGFQCVHAGLKNENLAENDEFTLLLDHHITKENHYRGKLTVTGHIHLNAPMVFDGKGGEGRVLPYEAWRPLPETGIICIDTSCVEGVCLTAMEIERNHFRLLKVPSEQ